MSESVDAFITFCSHCTVILFVTIVSNVQLFVTYY